MTLTTHAEMAGLPTVHVTTGVQPRIAVVMLHGYGMGPDALIPFATSLGVPAEFYVPEGPLPAGQGGRAWWRIDAEARRLALANGPRDLFRERPAGAEQARDLLRTLTMEVKNRHIGLPLALLGFSQGGMLACDAVIRRKASAAALVLLSSSRIFHDEWDADSAALAGLPVLVSHGDADDDLARSAGEALRDFCVAAGARVTWVPFAGGHEIPLVVWRHVRRFLQALGSAEDSQSR